MTKSFNVIDQPWIPVAGSGLVSLRQIFSDHCLTQLGGNPVQKIAVMKLLLAIAQAAWTPKDEAEWQEVGAEGLANKCLDYLDKWHGRFDLYDTEKPFLQMPAVATAIEARTQNRSLGKKGAKLNEALISGVPKPFGVGIYPDLPSENNTILSQSQIGNNLEDCERALFITTLMNFALGGKRVESGLNSLSGAELGSQYSASAAPSIGGYDGYLHFFPIGCRIIETIYICIMSVDDIVALNRWERIGRPVWEEMPKSESDDLAKTHSNSYQSTLISLSRFLLIKDDGIYYMDGISYPSVKYGWYEPSIAVQYGVKNEIKVKYVSTSVKPWRELESILAYLDSSSVDGCQTYLLQKGLDRSRELYHRIGVLSLGLKVSSNSGDQSIKREDDFVESTVWLDTSQIGKPWLSIFRNEMVDLKQLSKILYVCVISFYKSMQPEQNKLPPAIKARADSATTEFWQLVERDFQQLVDHCDMASEHVKVRQNLRRRFAQHVHDLYSQYCPMDSARQLQAWAKHRPKTHTYVTTLNPQEVSA